MEHTHTRTRTHTHGRLVWGYVGTAFSQHIYVRIFGYIWIHRVPPFVYIKARPLCLRRGPLSPLISPCPAPSLSRVFADAQTMLTYGGNNSFTGFTGLQHSLERLGERPGAWPSRTRTQTAQHPREGDSHGCLNPFRGTARVQTQCGGRAFFLIWAACGSGGRAGWLITGSFPGSS